MIGSNVSTVGGIIESFKQADEWGCECIQIYTTPSRTWKVNTRSEDEIKAFKDAWRESKVKCIVGHVPFLVNLASNDNELYRRSVNRLKTELKSAEQLGIDRIVMHPGSHSNNLNVGIDKVAIGINNAFKEMPKCRTKLLLETMPGQGNQIGRSFDELQSIIEKICFTDNIGICLDTCHLYSAGYNIRGYDGYKILLKEIHKTVGVDRVGAIHLNDSKHQFKSRRDRHVTIGNGFLGIEIFHAIVNEPLFAKIPKIVENPERDKESVKDIKLLISMKKTVHVKDSKLPSTPQQLDIFR